MRKKSECRRQPSRLRYLTFLYVKHCHVEIEKKKERKKTFCRDRFRTLTIVESQSKWLSLIFTSLEDPWLCTDWLSEIKRCKKTRVDCYQLAYAGLNGADSKVCKAGKTICSGFSQICNSTYQTYREPSVENKKKLTRLSKRKSIPVNNTNKLLF